MARSSRWTDRLIDKERERKEETRERARQGKISRGRQRQRLLGASNVSRSALPRFPWRACHAFLRVSVIAALLNGWLAA